MSWSISAVIFLCLLLFQEPLSWLKDVLEKGVLDAEHDGHPIFAVDAKQEEVRSIVASFRKPKNAEHLNGSWKKMKEHFVQVGI